MKGYYTADECRIEDFAALCGQSLEASALAFATTVEKSVAIYDMPGLADTLTDPDQRRALMAELAQVLNGLSGVLVLKHAVDPDAIDEASAIFERIIAAEKAGTGGGGDHFAKEGANDRIWNSLQKLCDADAEVFARYFAAPGIDAVSEAWLGPRYQMTTQVNLVRPGGEAQLPHRDYHLGFMSLEEAQTFPAHAHHLSPVLTLQGGIAHCDMPVESGPTKLLPFSQNYGPGYVAYHLPAFQDYFEEHCIQLPLEKGDAVFFNPALFHAAGANNSADIQRMVNLMQVSSPMGVPIEAVDRTGMARMLYPILARGGLTALERAAVIGAGATGYAFPTNLDTDLPVGGLTPESQSVMMARMLDAGASAEDFSKALDDQVARRQP